MQPSSLLDPKLFQYFKDPKRNNYKKNRDWLKYVQLQMGRFYSACLNFHYKYEMYAELKKSHSKEELDNFLRSNGYGGSGWFEWLKEIGNLLRLWLTSMSLKCQLINSAQKVSCKVSPKINPSFSHTYIYDDDHTTYYRLKKTLGRGSFGTGPNKVKKAVNIETNEKVAIKILRGNASDIEVTLLKQCNRYKGDFLVPSKKHQLVNQYIVQQLIPGKELQKIDVNKLSDCEVEAIIRKCFEQIANYHAAGIILVDIKEDNFLYDFKTGQLNFIDFGLSYSITKDEKSYFYSDGTVIQKSSITPAELADFKNSDIRLCGNMLKRLFTNHIEKNTDLENLLHTNEGNEQTTYHTLRI